MPYIHHMIRQNKRLTGILMFVAILLLIPLIAMQFTNEVNWSYFDFMMAGFLLLTAGLTCELALRKVKRSDHRIVICIVVLLMIFTIWAELAVGIFGSPFAGV